MTNENDQGNTNTHKGDIDSSNVKFEADYSRIVDYGHDSSLEEVYD